MGKEIERAFFQRRHTSGQQAHEKVVNITNHQENTNQNHSEISPHSCQDVCHQKDKSYQMLVRTQRKGIFMPCWWECHMVQPLWKTVWRFLKKLKIELLCDLAIPLLDVYPKETKPLSRDDYLHSYVHCSIIHSSQCIETT